MTLVLINLNHSKGAKINLNQDINSMNLGIIWVNELYYNDYGMAYIASKVDAAVINEKPHSTIFVTNSNISYTIKNETRDYIYNLYTMGYT